MRSYQYSYHIEYCVECQQWEMKKTERNSPGLSSSFGKLPQNVYRDFHRMSEDLPFVFSVPVDVTRSNRSKTTLSMKGQLAKLSTRLPCFKALETLQGHNNSASGSSATEL